jgi:hypothetical protein
VPRELLELGRNGQEAFLTRSVLLDELADVLERNKFAAFLAWDPKEMFLVLIVCGLNDKKVIL